ncbi:MAG TPA: hypothetical protein VM598_05425 [Bdellovibrionota bacterium]|nr:hypothetical protein [Bdellovibrionota bacterium]
MRDLLGALAYTFAGMAVLMLMNVVAFGHEGHSAAGVSSKLITVTGKIKALRSDDFKNKKSTSEFSVEDSSTGKIYTLHFSGSAGKKMFHGNEVTIKARDMGGDNLYMGSNDGTAILSAGTDLAIGGDQKTLVMMVSFIDAQVTCSQQQVNDLAFTDPNGYSMAGMYRETSFGALTVSGQTVANVMIPSTNSGCDYNTWAQQADQAASQMGVNLSGFPRRIYVLPGGSCGWAGLGNLGGTITRSWIAAGYCGYHDVYAHEFGHNIGMHHSGVTGAGEYDDTSDIMGYGGIGLRQVNGPHKVQMGWLPQSAVARVGSGVHTLIPLESTPGTGGYSVLTIPKPDTNDTYYLSYRRPIGLDSRLGGYADRLSIHTFTGGSVVTRLVGTLGVGETYTDSANGITVQVTSRTDSAMTVAINAVCTSNAPVVTVSPGTQGGGAGSALTYQISVQNRDSATCTPSTFSLSAAVPQGFSGALSTSMLTVNAGSTATASIAVASAAGTPTGTYSFSVSALDGSVPIHTASGTGNYVIDGEAPSAPAGLAGSTRGKKLTLRWSPSTDNVGVTGYTIYRNGAAIGSSTSNSYSLNVPSGVFTYYVTARDAAGNVSAASNTISMGR